MTRPYSIAGFGRHSVASVLEHVAFETEFEVADIVSPSRKTHLCRSRYLAAWLARRHTSATLGQIGLVLGGRDHSVVSHEVARAQQLRGSDPYFRWLSDHLDTLLVAA